MNKKLLGFVIAFLLIAGAGALAAIYLIPYNPEQPPKADDSGYTEQGVRDVINANNEFAFELYSKVNSPENNIFFSPYSISSAMAIAYEGSKGKTSEEISSVFHYPSPKILAPNFASIYNRLNNNSEKYELRTGNALWAQKDYKFLDDYMSKVESRYEGRATNLDFANEPEKSAKTINSFIEEQTNDKIKNLIDSNSITPLTKLIITNAVYFKGRWVWEFDKSETKDKDFKISSSRTVKVPMMHMKNDKAQFNYLDNEDLQILELPYQGEKLSMLIILPTEGINQNSSFTSDKLNELKEKMEKTALDDIYLPKFKFDTKTMLKETLISMGMPLAFDYENADFSGMNGEKALYIGQVIHQAYVKVDEKGTEAAAATAIMKGVTSAAPTPRKIFNADHPFIFIIQDKENGNILFIGKVANPLKK